MADNPKKEDDAPALVGEHFFKSRNVLVTGTIDDKLAKNVVSQLLALADYSDDPINMFISSPGGHVESGDMVHDVSKFIVPEVRCIGSGWVASAGALIFISAETKNRFCLPNTRFLLHQPSGGVGGPASDIEIQANQIKQMRERFDKLFSDATGQTPAKISEDTQRDFWLTAEEAIDYGLLGSIIESSTQLP